MGEGIRVIIADDHTLLREGTRRILDEQPDIDVVGEAADGEQAVALAQRLRPDVAIIDIAMPHLDGIEATRRIKALIPTLAVIILTVHDEEEFVVALIEAGAAGYLLKDVKGSQLVDAVRAVRAGEAVLHPIIARKLLGRIRRNEANKQVPQQEALTDRELEVLKLAARGLSNKDIGRELALSARTVQVHLNHVFQKLSVASRTEAVVHGLRQGWFELEDLT
jgi:DNA-binding NarL/FixJ family response regulator